MKKKIIALVLALVVIATPLLTVLSGAKEAESVPNVNVHGLMGSVVYIDPNDPNSDVAWPPSTDAILDAVKQSAPYLAEFVATKDWAALGENLTPIVNKMFEPIVCNSDGSPNGTTGIRFKYPAASSINKNSKVNFRYDWRLDPVEIAAQLNDFIDYVLKCSKCDKVTITCHSLGGVITTSYLAIYGDSKVKSVCFNATAVYGETYTGELMTGQITLSTEAIQNYLSYAFDYNENKELLDAVVEIAKKTGLVDYIVKFGNTLVDKALVQLSRDSLVPMFGGWLSIWAMIPDEYIDQAETFVFDTVYAGMDYSALKAKVDNYNEKVRCKKTATIQKLNDDAYVYVISRNGYSSLPLTPSYAINGDGVIDTHNTSFGATVSLYGTTLSDDYLKNVDPKYVSPDKTIDASTCMFPEQTWFIKGMQHGNNPDSIDNMMYTLVGYNGQATVDTFEQYPRFLQYDSANDVISPYTEVAATPSFFERIVIIFKQLISVLKQWFSK